MLGCPRSTRPEASPLGSTEVSPGRSADPVHTPQLGLDAEVILVVSFWGIGGLAGAWDNGPRVGQTSRKSSLLFGAEKQVSGCNVLNVIYNNQRGRERE